MKWPGNLVSPCKRQGLSLLFWLSVIAASAIAAWMSDMHFFYVTLTCSLLVLFLCRPESGVHSITMDQPTLAIKAATVLILVATILLCLIPMGWSPIWNGQQPEHRNQYELMAENLLEGRLHFDYGDEEQLSQLENPYEPDEREEAGVSYHWDHAFYNGRYYMYFGVVPVFLLFLPYRLITGLPLTTYHATQIFVLLIILGFFVLLPMLAKRFFPRLPCSVYIAAATGFSLMSSWYATAVPAMYCTAITAALALEIWSLYFFIRAVWVETQENRQIWMAAIGALLGALTFGCRPPIALANIVVIPMLITYLRKNAPPRWTLIGKLFLAALPYVFVAAALMLYNYARFEDPFEFGQKYQLTVVDQSGYGLKLSKTLLRRLFYDTKAHLFEKSTMDAQFPYLNYGGVFINYPILLLTASFCLPSVQKQMRRHRLTGLLWGFATAVLVITAMDILWAPFLLERYRMDIYFLIAIASFLCFGFWHQAAAPWLQGLLNTAMIGLSLLTCITSVLFYYRTMLEYTPYSFELLKQLLFFVRF